MNIFRVRIKHESPVSIETIFYGLNGIKTEYLRFIDDGYKGLDYVDLELASANIGWLVREVGDGYISLDLTVGISGENAFFDYCEAISSVVEWLLGKQEKPEYAPKSLLLALRCLLRLIIKHPDDSIGIYSGNYLIFDMSTFKQILLTFDEYKTLLYRISAMP